MKQFCARYALLLLFGFPAVKQINATPICLADVYYDGIYQLQFKRTGNLYIARGEAYLNEGRVWPAWGFYNSETGETELHVINPDPVEGCHPYLDSFVNFMIGRGSFDENTGEYLFGAKGHQSNYCQGEDLGGPDVFMQDCNHASPSPQMNLRNPSKIINGLLSNKDNSAILKVSPNPVSSSAVIQYTLKEKSSVSIIIYDYVGKPVKILVDKETKAAGAYSINWNRKGSNNIPVNPGFYKIVAVIENKSYSTSVQVISC